MNRRASRRLVLHFPARLVDRPIVYRLVKDYDLSFNILKASISPEQEGVLVIEVEGEQDKLDQGINYLTSTGVAIEALSQNILRNEDKCVHCGACITICPVQAFVLDPESRCVDFIDERCIVCELCLKTCPYRAMELHF